jgi:hypothetical protein
MDKKNINHLTALFFKILAGVPPITDYPQNSIYYATSKSRNYSITEPSRNFALPKYYSQFYPFELTPVRELILWYH